MDHYVSPHDQKRQYLGRMPCFLEAAQAATQPGSEKTVKDGYVRFPEDDLLRCCGQSFGMSDIRNNIEWYYGWPE